MPTVKSDQSVAAVVVTYNRLALLRECLAALRGQTRAIDEIIVVNNASTDGTAEWLAARPDLTVIHQANLGSSGGQFTGVKAACQRGHNWIWCMDDDTIPQPDALAALCRTPGFQDRSAGFLASILVFPDGRIQPSNYPLRPAETWIATAGKDFCVGASSSTFVSVLVNAEVVRTQGLPVTSFFLIWDDTEFTERIGRGRPGFFVLDSIAVHKTPDLGNPGHSTLSRKFLHHQRNRIIYLRLQPIPFWKKWYRVGKLVLRDLLLILCFRYRPVHLGWTLRGVFAPARIEYPPPAVAAREPAGAAGGAVNSLS